METTPEGIIEKARIERGVSKAWLARQVGMDRDNLAKALLGYDGRTLSTERRTAAAKALGIPSFVVDTWET